MDSDVVGYFRESGAEKGIDALLDQNHELREALKFLLGPMPLSTIETIGETEIGLTYFGYPVPAHIQRHMLRASAELLSEGRPAGSWPSKLGSSRL